MINHKIAEPCIEVMMGYFITNLSIIVPVKEFLKCVNIWQSYRKMVDRVIHPIRLKTFVLKDAELAG